MTLFKSAILFILSYVDTYETILHVLVNIHFLDNLYFL